MEAANYSPSLKQKDIEDAKADNILESTLISSFNKEKMVRVLTLEFLRVFDFDDLIAMGERFFWSFQA